ncbi:MAG: FAD-binding protein, partial [Dehalococcoidia bacterium]|nr:FAD-binding protein [Dehalococcoidia bacterium]
NHQDLLLALTNEIPRCLGLLDHWGMRYLKSEGKYVQVRFPGSRHNRVPRSCRSGIMLGPEYRRLFPKQLRRLGVRALGDMQALEILKRDGAAVGVLALDTLEGRFVGIRAKAVVLATGGFMGMYPLTATSPTLVGEGQGMAYEAGAQVQDMEFADFYSNSLAWPPMYAGSIDVATMLRIDLNGKVFNSRGEEFLVARKGSGLAQPVLCQQEIRSARGSPNGGVYLSFKHLPDNLIQAYLSSLGDSRLLHSLKVMDIDIRRQALEIAPAPLEAMGGCRIDSGARTNVPGLFAAGEVAGGAEGAFTMAGNPIALNMAMGAIAGRESAGHASGAGKSTAELPNLAPSIEAALRPLQECSAEAIPALEARRELQTVLGDHLHLLGRTRDSLEKAIEKIASIRRDAGRWQVRTAARRHNAEWMGCLELRHMVTASEMVARAALARAESRGLHYREDYPEPSPEWLCNIVLQRHGDEMRVSRVPVAFTFIRPPEPQGPPASQAPA